VFVGLLVLDCRIGAGHSLKEKRHVLLNVTGQLKRKFNVSVAEVGYQDLWQRTKLAIAYVNSDGRLGRSVLDKIRSQITADPRLMILDSEIVQLY
jgi:hypothetical protein